MNSEEKIKEMVKRIVKEFNPEKIILFGSHAKGQVGPDSDVDLLIVMEVSGSKRKKAVEIDMELAESGIPKDVIVVTPEEVERFRDIVGTIIYPAIREGQLYHWWEDHRIPREKEENTGS